MLGKVGDALMQDGAVMLLRGQRQSVLAANIANADTPNYKAQDFDFAKALQNANQKTSLPNTAALQTTHGKHLGGSDGVSGNLSVRLQFRPSTQPSLDGNTVDMDTERTQFADNALRYETAIRNLNGTIRSIQSALQISG